MLKQLKLTDFCNHKELEAEFKAGVNCVVGFNGCGKSSAINAIYGALTNSYEHPEGTKGVIRQGAKSAHIELTFDEFTITRDIGEKNTHLLQIGDQTFRAAKDIENELATRFNLAKTILDKFVFIRQGKFTEIVNLSDSERAKTLAHLSNVAYFEVLWKKLAEESKAHESALKSIPVFDEQSVLTQTEELTKEIQEATLKEQTFQSELNALDENWCNDALNLNQQLTTANTLIVGYAQEKQRFEAELAEVEGQIFRFNAMYQAAEADLQKAQLSNSEVAEINQYNQYCSNAARIQAEQAECNALSVELAGWNSQALKDANAKLTVHIQEIIGNQTKLQMQLRYATNASKGQQCEVCGALPEHQFKSDPTAISKALQIENEKKIKLEQRLAENNALIVSNDRKSMRLEDLESKLAQYDIEQFVGNAAYYETLITKYQQQLKYTVELEKVRNELDRYSNTRLGITRSLENLQTLTSDSQKLINNTQQITEDANKARKTLNRIQELKIELVTLRTIIQEKQKHLISLKDLLKHIQEKRKQKKLRKYIELLEETRTLVHRDSIPHLISKRFLQQLTIQMNAYLTDFEAPFKVAVGNDLGFRALMDSGAAVPASALSGGQQTMLSSAFWLSVFQTNAGHTGLLVLDEPNAALDESNRKIFNNMLQKIDEIFKRQGQQLLLVSHDIETVNNFHTICL